MQEALDGRGPEHRNTCTAQGACSCARGCLVDYCDRPEHQPLVVAVSPIDACRCRTRGIAALLLSGNHGALGITVNVPRPPPLSGAITPCQGPSLTALSWLRHHPSPPPAPHVSARWDNAGVLPAIPHANNAGGAACQTPCHGIMLVGLLAMLHAILIIRSPNNPQANGMSSPRIRAPRWLQACEAHPAHMPPSFLDPLVHAFNPPSGPGPGCAIRGSCRH